jgi:sterol desaturase/sphingolipid hydroxylase (fatty acid hydroxylase superfamily)
VYATAGQVIASVLLALATAAVLAPLEKLSVGARPWTVAGDGLPRFLLQLTAGLLLFDLAGYVAHRLAHRVPWLWRLHSVHHASQTMDWLASFRQHPLEIAWMTIAQNAPLVLLGIPLGAHAAVLAALQLHTVFVHANVRVPGGAWRLVVATPGFHHRHHQRDGAVRNYASLFPALDVLFQTYDPAPAGAPGLATRATVNDVEAPRTWTAYKPFEPSEGRPG